MQLPLAISALLLVAAAGGCNGPGARGDAPSGGTTAATTASSHAPPAPSSSAVATTTGTDDAGTVGGIPAEKIAKQVNPEGRPAYSGPTGTLRGVIKVEGDEPPAKHFAWPPNCRAASAVYGKLFRVGQDSTLADVLVAVTGYDGYVPPAKPSILLTVQDCAFSSRTVALTYGQTLQVRNLDARESYLPMLEGAHAVATLVAIPQGEAVTLFAPEPKRYRLTDQMSRPFLVADVFVLRYATTAITDLSGRYEIKGIPTGKVKVSALLPAAKMKAVNQETEIKAGDNTLDLTIAFDAAKDAP